MRRAGGLLSSAAYLNGKIRLSTIAHETD